MYQGWPTWGHRHVGPGEVVALHCFDNVCSPYRKKLMHERQFARAPSFARVIPHTYLDLHVRSKICISVKESFLLLKHVKYFI